MAESKGGNVAQRSISRSGAPLSVDPQQQLIEHVGGDG